MPSPRPSIQPNGQEYLVEYDGSVFLALSRTQAETIVRCMGGLVRGDENAHATVFATTSTTVFQTTSAPPPRPATPSTVDEEPQPAASRAARHG